MEAICSSYIRAQISCLNKKLKYSSEDHQKGSDLLFEQKSEVLLWGASSSRETVPVDSISVGEVSIPFSNVVKTLGVTFDDELSWNCMSQPLSDLVCLCIVAFSPTSDLWVKSVHTSPAKLQAALLSHWFCQSMITVMAFCRDCPKSRLNFYRQCKMLLQEL